MILKEWPRLCARVWAGGMFCASSLPDTVGCPFLTGDVFLTQNNIRLAAFSSWRGLKRSADCSCFGFDVTTSRGSVTHVPLLTHASNEHIPPAKRDSIIHALLATPRSGPQVAGCCASPQPHWSLLALPHTHPSAPTAALARLLNSTDALVFVMALPLWPCSSGQVLPHGARARPGPLQLPRARFALERR